MQHLIVASILALMAAADPQTAPQPAGGSDKRTRDVYVSVVDGRGNPVSGLSAADFVVKEDGTAREVLSAGPATEPLTISLLIDDSEAATDAVQFMREGLTSFVKRLAGKAEIAVATIGERPVSQLDFTTSTEAVTRVVSRIFQRAGSGAYLLDGIVEASRGLQKRRAPRPHIVAISSEGPEFGNGAHQQVLEALFDSGASLHVLVLGQPSGSMTDEMRNRNIVIGDGTEKTGGRRDQVLALSGLTGRLNQLADELTSQYVVQYARPDQLIPPEKIQVSVTRRGLTVRARTRATER